MSDRIFYTLHRFFEALHGPGESAQFAAYFAWSFLFFLNVSSLILIVLLIAGSPPSMRSYVMPLMVIAGLIIGVTQHARYLEGNRLAALCGRFQREPVADRSFLRWLTALYVAASVLMMVLALWRLVDLN